ncbi:MAG TPA: chromosomal replication initiator protein DnaA [Dehalococcoidia bacterium]
MDDTSARRLWEAALGELQLQVTRPNYDTWLKETVGIRYDGRTLVAGTPSDFATEWLGTRLRPLIKKTLAGILGQAVEVDFELAAPEPREADVALAAPPSQERRPGQQLRAPAFPRLRLNPKYTFETFIVGASNRLAHAAAHSVAERPGETYNPLFLYGGVGLGKTNLLHAIGHRVQAARLRVLYVSSEQFTNEFVNAIRERRNEEFRAKYRNVDVLLIDDIQFISGKEQTQEEFFHTFNDLHAANRQIVITSDRSPRYISLLEDRLRSRFEWGLIADIQPPDLETRLAILRAKAEEQGVALPQDVYDLIAHRVQHNIRELEGSLNRVIAFAKLMRSEVTLDLATQALAGLAQPGSRRVPTPDAILKAVAEFYQLTPEALRSKSRDKRLAWARHVAMYLLREDGQRPLTEIGRLLGGRDHSTVIHGCTKVEQALAEDLRLRQEVNEIRAALNKGAA